MNFIRIFSLLIFWLSVLYSHAQPNTPDSNQVAMLAILSDIDAGFYEETLTVSLRCVVPDAKIYYTTDGTAPTGSSELYKNALKINKTLVLKAVAIKDGKRGTQAVFSYFIKEPTTKFPVISISTKAGILFDPHSGLFSKGPRASKSFPYRGANFYANKTVVCHVEIFEAEDTMGIHPRVFSNPLGLKIFGGMSRVFPQKSMALYARKEYGAKDITHPLFPDLPIKKYKRLVLRNSGSDYGETHFRDAFITSLGREMGLEVQAYRPSLVYINGRYWGVMNMREKLTKHYFEEHFGFDKDSIDLLEHRRYVQAGSRKHYEVMQAYMGKYDLSKAEHFARVAEMMDVDNFMEYEIIQIYIDNQDAGGNIKFWRPQTPDGRWRWVLFDTDFGFGHYSQGGYKFNSLEFHTASNGPVWPNPAWSTFNLRMLLKNEDFKTRFVTRFCDRMNTVFETAYVLNRIDSMAAVIEPEMRRHWTRWQLTPKDWTFRVEQMREFAKKRPEYMRKFLQKKFPEIGAQVRLLVTIEGGGHLMLNDLIPIKTKFEGYYFKNLTVYLKPQPYFGYQFSHWEVNRQPVRAKAFEMQFLSDFQHVKAIFVEGEHPLAKQVIINEISCRDTTAGDWIEFYNHSSQDLNLEGWLLRDGDNNSYTFPNVTIKGKDYLVLCREEAKFRTVFQAKMNLLSGLSFGLGRRKDKVELYTPDGEPVDSVGYKVGHSKDSVFLSLALRDFESDNGDFKKHWKYDYFGGSPGSINPHYLQWKNEAASASNEGSDYKKFMDAIKIGVATTGIFVAIIFAYLVLRKRLEKPEER